MSRQSSAVRHVISPCSWHSVDICLQIFASSPLPLPHAPTLIPSATIHPLRMRRR